MCTVVRVITDNDEVDCETLGELADALGIADYLALTEGAYAEEDECLCLVDIAKFGGRKWGHMGVIDRRSWV